MKYFPASVIVLVVFAMLQSTVIFASLKTDSLNLLLTKSNDIKEKVKLLNHLSWEMKYANIDSADNCARQALELSLKINDTEGQTFAYRNLTAVNAIKSDWETSKAFAEKGIALARENGYTYELAKIYNLMGLIYRNQTAYSDALQYHKLALEIYREMNDEREIAGVLNNIGLIYTRVNDISKALKVYLEVLDAERKLNNNEGVARTLNSIANVYDQNGDRKEAIDYYKQAIELCEKIDHKYYAAANYHNIASVYYTLHQDSLALYNLRKAIEKNKILQNKLWLLLNYQLMGNINFENKNYSETLKYYHVVDSLLPLVNDKLQYCKQYHEWSKYYLTTGQYETARHFAQNSLELAEKLNLLEERINAHKLLYLISKSGSQTSLALMHLEISNSLSDTLAKVQKEEQVNDLKTRYETDIKIRENEFLASENRSKSKIISNQRYLMITVISLLVFFVLLAITIYRSRQKGKKAKALLENLNRQVNDQKKELEVRAKSLASINEQLTKMDKFKEVMTHMLVHDLKNPLNIMVNLPAFKDHKNKDEIILQSSRTMLNLVMNLLDVSKFENDAMQLHLQRVLLSEIVKEAFNEVSFLFEQKNIKIKNEMQHDFTMMVDKGIIKRVIVNLLTNASKFSPSNGAVKINVNILKDGSLSIGVIDSGPGVPEEHQFNIFEKYFQLDHRDTESVRSTGIGLTFCKMAIEAHKGVIGVHSQINKGSEFWFTLPDAEVKNDLIAQETLQIQNTTDYSNLGEPEMTLLLPYINNLKKLKVYEVTDIMKIIKDIDSLKMVSLNPWLVKLNHAVASCNEENYVDLLIEISDDQK